MPNFYAYVTNFRSLTALIGKAALAIPFITLIYNIGPPWLTPIAVAILTSIVQIFVLIYIFQFWMPLSRLRRKLRLRLSIIFGGVSLIGYLGLFAFFVFNAPDTNNRDIKGFIYTEAAKAQINSAYPEQRALQGAGFEPTLIWEPWTVYV